LEYHYRPRDLLPLPATQERGEGHNTLAPRPTVSKTALLFPGPLLPRREETEKSRSGNVGTVKMRPQRGVSYVTPCCLRPFSYYPPMTTPNQQVRRATIEDLQKLIVLWQQEGLPWQELEKRFKEFQVVEGEESELLGTVGLQISGHEGCLHS